MAERGGALKAVVDAISRWWREARFSGRVTSSEYWVFLPTEKLPAQDDVMSQLMQSGAITAREGILFSDVRLHVSLVLRSKNPHAFRPDLYSESASPTAELLTGLSESMSFARLRYLSEVPVDDDRHLAFMPHLASAYSLIGNSQVVYDVSAQRLQAPRDLVEALKAEPRPTSSEFHVNVAWHPTELGGAVETYGMSKRGLPDLRTLDCLADQRILAGEVMREIVSQAWDACKILPSTTVNCFDDSFQASIKPVRNGPWMVRLHRGEFSEASQ